VILSSLHLLHLACPQLGQFSDLIEMALFPSLHLIRDQLRVYEEGKGTPTHDHIKTALFFDFEGGLS